MRLSIRGSPVGEYMPVIYGPPSDWKQQWVRTNGKEVPPPLTTYDLTVETFNSTSWPTMLLRLKTSKCCAILAQEIGVLKENQAARSREALALGWHSIIVCSEKGEAYQTRAGVAIFARGEVCLRPDSVKLPEHEGGWFRHLLNRLGGLPSG